MTPILIASYLVAHVFWFILFAPLTAGLINFWVGMTISSGFLALTALLVQRKAPTGHWAFKPAHIIIGLASALVLYGIFFLGHKLSTTLLPFAQNQIMQIYTTRAQMPSAIIGLLLFFWIGPAEEIFWRGLLQKHLTERLGSEKGYLLTSFMYALVHAYALNFMLFMAALICGAFWGYIYKRQGSLWPVIISHAVWDVTIFVLLPIR